jgi:pimeloyl-ACP methyl ester carboxylesterase
MGRRTKLGGLICAVVIWAACASAQVKKQDADLTAPDGVKIKVSYFSAGKPGPGVLLMHQCNRDRTSWDGLATQMAQAGIHVVALDYRGYGESGGERFLSLPPEKAAAEQLKWSGDIDLAYQYLLSQAGVDKARMGAGGASCGVNNAVHLAHRHPEVKTLVLLSGPVDDETIQFVESNTRMPILSAASEDDGDMLPTMRWLMGFARNPQDKLLTYTAAGHGTEMFKVEKGLPPMIIEWYKTTLWQAPATESAKSASKPSAIMEFWDLLVKPGGAASATKMYLDAKKKDPNVFLFPESMVNVLGYQRLQQGNTKEAIEILKLNELAYPRSANVYDSLGDAYLTDHQNELALQYSERALKVLAEHPGANAAFAQGIRQSAEDKIHKLKPQ